MNLVITTLELRPDALARGIGERGWVDAGCHQNRLGGDTHPFTRRQHQPTGDHRVRVLDHVGNPSSRTVLRPVPSDVSPRDNSASGRHNSYRSFFSARKASVVSPM